MDRSSQRSGFVHCPLDDSQGGVTPLSFFGNAYVVLDNNGGGNAFNWVDINDGSNPAFTGATFTLNLGNSLKIGGEAQTFPQALGTTVSMFYKIDSGSFVQLNLPYAGARGNNDLWQEAGAGMQEIGTGLGLGQHTLEVYYQAVNENTLYVNNGDGSNYKATINVVPEPTTMLLVGMGLAGAMMLRRRKA